MGKILFGVGGDCIYPGYFSRVAGYHLRLESPLDPTNDVNLKLKFDTSYQIEAGKSVGFGGANIIYGHISTAEMPIDYSAFIAGKN
jgi:hypothetical protein